MIDHVLLFRCLAILVITCPAGVVVILGLSSLVDRKLTESATSKLCQGAIITALLAAVGVFVLMLLDGTRYHSIELAEWVAIPNYHFSIKLVFDRLSVPFVILSFLLCGTIAAFATRYLHRESGYNRFFVLYALFVLGIVLTSLAGTIETLFAGWELVGLSSILLVAFFHDRPAPVRNGLRVWIVYRISDAALLLAAILMHHLHGKGDFDQLLGGSPWPKGAAVAEPSVFFIGILLIIAAAGKSALVPFFGWLPRAMEGPTPSSAVFYGALSVHLGAFLLLRISPILEASAGLSALVIGLGVATALLAYLVGSVQTDIKSVLAFASLVQVGLIVAEIGLGFRYVALVHLLGNACLRTLQFVRAPTLLHDYHLLENAIGEHLPRSNGPLGHFATGSQRRWLYRFAIERGYLDGMLNEFVVAPFFRLFQWCDSMERRWTNLLSGSFSRDADLVKPHSAVMEELP